MHCQKKQQKHKEQEQRRQEQEQSPHELRDRLVESIVLAIFSNGGRFLKNHRSTGMWVEISFKEAIGKTKQALQDRRRKTRGCGNSSGNHHQNNNNHTDNDINNDNDKNRGNRNVQCITCSSILHRVVQPEHKQQEQEQHSSWWYQNEQFLFIYNLFFFPIHAHDGGQ